MQSKLSLSDPTRCMPYTRYSSLGFGFKQRQAKKLSSRFGVRCLGHKWRLNEIDTNAVQEQVNSWLLKTQNFLTDMTSPLVKNGQGRRSDSISTPNSHDVEEIFMTEQTIYRRTSNGYLSLAAVVAIEQFSRMNGLTGQKMQKIFKALVPQFVHNDARNLIEYCCFRYLSRDSAHVHPSLKELAFQKLIFMTMLGWDSPYCEGDGVFTEAAEKFSFENKLVQKAAFCRIAPAIAGVADQSTVHNLFKALAGDENGISLSLWLTYIGELLKVHEGRRSYPVYEYSQDSEERILCIASSKKRPVLKWENYMAWPGKIILTDKALYFETVGMTGRKDTLALDLTKHGLCVEKAKVGPLGSGFFDSAISISCPAERKKWVFEFVDLGGETRRDVWHAFISEVIALHKFIDDYGLKDGDQSVVNVYGAQKGKERTIVSAANGIARLQALQFMKRLVDDPMKLVQFSYLQKSPYGTIVCQALAVNFWGGPLVTRLAETGNETNEEEPTDDFSENRDPVFDIDGSIYLPKWMRSPSWASTMSIDFWKNSSIKHGLVLSKNLVVADAGLVEKAAITCRHKSQLIENTQATIDAAMVKGIPSNIDLFKEIMLPLTITMKNFEKLRHWEEPHLTVTFLSFAYTIIFRNLLSYMFPAVLIILAACMLTLKGLKEQGRLGRSFGKITIHDQPPSNTIQKIIAVKDAMRDVETYLQNLNVVFLKIRTIVLSGQPQITTEVALVLLASATVMLIVPFKYILSFLVFDLFTRELELRREMVKRFTNFLKERWEMIPVAPVIVLPYESTESTTPDQRLERNGGEDREKIQRRSTSK